MRVFEALAQAFVDEGTETVFSLMGDANMYWMDALLRSGGVRNVHARHENSVLAMADGYARAGGRVGVATVTSGPGLTHLATALIGAVRYRSPLVLFAGDTSAGDVRALQYVDQQSFVSACGAVYIRVTSGAECLDRVREAFHIARTRRTPVVLGVPMDVQEAQLPIEYQYHQAPQPSPAIVPDSLGIDAAAGLIASSNRPIFVVGVGAMEGGALAAIRALGDRIGALYSTTLLAKGVMDDCEYSLGIAGTFSTPYAEQQFESADLVIGVGASLNRFTTQDGHLFPNARTIQIVDCLSSDVASAALPTLHLRGDAAATVRALEELLAFGGHSSRGMRTDAILGEGIPGTVHAWPAEREVDDHRMDPRTLVEVMEEELQPASLISSGAGHFWAFTNAGLSGRDGRGFIFSLGFGAIGQALPVGIGAAIAQPDRPVTVIDGDSSILMYIQEIDTAVRADVNLQIVVIDDDAMGSELHKLALRNMDTSSATIATPSLDVVASGFGASGVVVRSAKDLAKEMAGFDWRGVKVIDAKITDRVVELSAVMGNAPSRE